MTCRGASQSASKYGRKVAIARTMARYMAPLVASSGNPVLVAVPLHRTRLWQRGFNQSALVAREISRRLNVAADPFLIRRIKRTPPLKGMSPLQRRKAVAGAFKVPDRSTVEDGPSSSSTTSSPPEALRKRAHAP
jgi:predicted amidophosphoribosyltransferase